MSIHITLARDHMSLNSLSFSPSHPPPPNTSQASPKAWDHPTPKQNCGLGDGKKMGHDYWEGSRQCPHTNDSEQVSGQSTRDSWSPVSQFNFSL